MESTMPSPMPKPKQTPILPRRQSFPTPALTPREVKKSTEAIFRQVLPEQTLQLKPTLMGSIQLLQQRKSMLQAGLIRMAVTLRLAVILLASPAPTAFGQLPLGQLRAWLRF